MTPTPPPIPATTPGFVLTDFDLPDRPPLAHAEDYETALFILAAAQEEFLRQLDANGEGGGQTQLSLAVTPIDTTGAIGEPCYIESINGLRPVQR